MVNSCIQDNKFNSERLARLFQLERSHFWFSGRQALIERLLKKYLKEEPLSILDIGCRSGFMVELLARRGHHVTGIDIVLPDCPHDTAHNPSQTMLIKADALKLPFAENSFDSVMMFDILEHDDDVKALSEARRVLRPGGLSFITVPAMPWLWSCRDEIAGHLRRYTRKGLFRLLEHSQFQILEMNYYQFLLFPFVIISRLLGRRSSGVCELEEKPHPIINKVFTMINRFEAKFSGSIPLPWGSSLAAVCRKR